MKILLLLLIPFLRPVPCEMPGCLKADIIILADVSGSIKGYEDFLNTAIVSFIDGLQITDNGIRVGIVAFSDVAETIVPITGNPDIVDDNFKKFESDQGGTDMAEGFFEVIAEFSRNGREDFQQIIIVISDGDTKRSDECIAIADQF